MIKNELVAGEFFKYMSGRLLVNKTADLIFIYPNYCHPTSRKKLRMKAATNEFKKILISQ